MHFICLTLKIPENTTERVFEICPILFHTCRIIHGEMLPPLPGQLLSAPERYTGYISSLVTSPQRRQDGQSEPQLNGQQKCTGRICHAG